MRPSGLLLVVLAVSIGFPRPLDGQDARLDLPGDVRSQLLAAEYSCAGLRLIRGFWFSDLRWSDSAAVLLRDFAEGSSEILDPGRRAILGMARDFASGGSLREEIQAALERVPSPENAADPALVWMELGGCAFSSDAADAAIFAAKTFEQIDERWQAGSSQGTLSPSDRDLLYAPLVELWAEAVRLAPAVVTFREIYASQASLWGDVNEAVAQAREAVRLSDSREESEAVLASVLRQRAATLQRRGQIADALRDVDEAAPLGRRAAPMLIQQRVGLMADVGRAEEARGWIEDIRPAYPQDGWDRFFERMRTLIDTRHRTFLARGPTDEDPEARRSSLPAAGRGGSTADEARRAEDAETSAPVSRESNPEVIPNLLADPRYNREVEHGECRFRPDGDRTIGEHRVSRDLDSCLLELFEVGTRPRRVSVTVEQQRNHQSLEFLAPQARLGVIPEGAPRTGQWRDVIAFIGFAPDVRDEDLRRFNRIWASVEGEEIEKRSLDQFDSNVDRTRRTRLGIEIRGALLRFFVNGRQVWESRGIYEWEGTVALDVSEGRFRFSDLEVQIFDDGEWIHGMPGLIALNENRDEITAATRTWLASRPRQARSSGGISHLERIEQAARSLRELTRGAADDASRRLQEQIDEVQRQADETLRERQRAEAEGRRSAQVAERRRAAGGTRQQGSTPRHNAEAPVGGAPSVGPTPEERRRAEEQRRQQQERMQREQERQREREEQQQERRRQAADRPPSWVDPTSPHPPCRGAGLETFRESDVRAQCELLRRNADLVEAFRRNARTVTITVHSTCEVDSGNRQEGAVTSVSVNLELEGVISGSHTITGAWWGNDLPEFRGGGVIIPSDASAYRQGTWISPRWRQYRVTYDRRRHPSGPPATFDWSISRPFQLSERGSQTVRVRDGGVYDFQGRNTGGLPGCFR